MRTMFILAVALLLGGCSAQQLLPGRMARVPADKPPAYRQGYEAGCMSAMNESCPFIAQTRFERDDARMKTDSDYALGWNDGARVCTADCAGSTFVYMPGK